MLGRAQHTSYPLIIYSRRGELLGMTWFIRRFLTGDADSCQGLKRRCGRS